jgi:F-type H+-transporting ATPase subunit delta
MSDSEAEARPENPPVATRVFNEKASELARTYAEALVNAAGKDGPVDEVLDELDAIRAFLIEQNPTFALMMTSPVRSTKDKDRIIAEAFEGHALPISVRFLRVLNRHGRLDLIGRVLVEARALWDRRQNRRPVTVRSAVPLSDAQLDALRDRLHAQLDATPILHPEVDPALIGGLVVQVGDHVFDGSVRNRLEQLRNRLTEGKSHEIQSRRDHFSHPE